MTGFVGFIFYIVVLVFSVVIHEVSHGLMARRLGDDTAERAGRLTLNPLKHIDPFGSIIFPLIMYLLHLPGLAWARPVPYNPNALFKDFRYGPLKVALAGPLSNIFLFVLFGLAARTLYGVISPLLLIAFAFIAYLNASLAFFNLLPIPPLDGSKILPLLLPPRYAHIVETAGLGGIFFVFIFISFFSSAISFVVSHAFAIVAGPHVAGLF